MHVSEIDGLIVFYFLLFFVAFYVKRIRLVPNFELALLIYRCFAKNAIY